MPKLLLGVFEDERELLQAALSLRHRQVAVLDAYTPFPVPGLLEALKLPHSRLGWVAAIAGLSAAFGMFVFQVWIYSHSWPVNIGGRPVASLPAYIPVTFEIGVLSASLATLLAFLIRSRLYPGKQAALPDKELTNSRFALLLQAPDPGWEATRDLLLQLKAKVRDLPEGPA